MSTLFPKSKAIILPLRPGDHQTARSEGETGRMDDDHPPPMRRRIERRKPENFAMALHGGCANCIHRELIRRDPRSRHRRMIIEGDDRICPREVVRCQHGFPRAPIV